MNYEMYIKEGHHLTKTLNKLTKTEPTSAQRDMRRIIGSNIFYSISTLPPYIDKNSKILHRY